jgi:hypothetical protein
MTAFPRDRDTQMFVLDVCGAAAHVVGFGHSYSVLIQRLRKRH